MKKNKVISLALLLFLVLDIALPTSVAAPGGDPQDATIKQVMKDTALHLGYSVSWDGTLVESPRTHYKYGVSSPDHRSDLIYLSAYSTESDAEFAWSQSKVTSEPVYTETFHGYDAFYIQSTLTRYHFYARIGRFVLETHCVGCTGPDKLSADVLYNKALQHGLFSLGGTTTTPTPDSDGDGVPDDVDTCPGTPAGVAVDDKGCPIGMQLSLGTDKNTYSPGEAVIISGSVWDAKGGLDGATVVVNVGGTKLSATTDSSGKYKKEVPLPSDISQGKHTVTVTASKTGYPDVSKTTSFNVGGKFKVNLETDKKEYAIGDTIKINGVVTSPDPIGSDLDLNLEISIYDSSGSVYRILRPYIHSDGSYDEQIKIYNEDKPAPWGESGKPGKWKIEAIAKKAGYPDEKADKTIFVQGCGDQFCQNDNGEYCYNCPEDCKCDQGKICDPFSKYTDPKTKCSPKVAYMYLNPEGLDTRHLAFMHDDILFIWEFYLSEGYKVERLQVKSYSDVSPTLSNPSTKAIAYFGHASEPSIAHVDAAGISTDMYMTLSGRYSALGLNDTEAMKKAKERADHPNLDYAYMHTCYSLGGGPWYDFVTPRDTSLADYLLHSKGTYWGEEGVLTSTCSLEVYVKP